MGTPWPAAALDGTVRLWDVADPAHPRPLGQLLTGGRRRRRLGGVQPRRAHARQRRLRRHGPAVGYRRSRSPAPARPDPDRRRRRGVGGVQPRRAHAGQRQPRRHDLAMGCRRSRIPQPARPAPDRAATGAVESVAFSPDGHTLASGSLDGIIRLWSLPQTVLTGSSGSPSMRWRSAPTGTPSRAATTGARSGCGMSPIPRTPGLLGPTLTGGTAAVDSAAFSPDGHTLASRRRLDGTYPAVGCRRSRAPPACSASS